MKIFTRLFLLRFHTLLKVPFLFCSFERLDAEIDSICQIEKLDRAKGLDIADKVLLALEKSSLFETVRFRPS